MHSMSSVSSLDAVFGKEQAGGFDDFLLEFPAGGGVFGRFVHVAVLFW